MRNRLLMIGIGLVAFLVVTPLPGAFATITLDSSGLTVFQQTTNNPCVIGDPSCQEPAGFTYNSQSGPAAGGTYDLFSPTYHVGAQAGVASGNLIPTTFTLGIDTNYANTLEFYDFVKVYVNGSLTYDVANSWLSGTGGTTLAQHNGNGYSDAILTGYSFNVGDNVVFEAKWHNDTDGMEEFFIIPTGSPSVPEPSTLLLLGGGLVGLAFYGRKAFKR